MRACDTSTVLPPRRYDESLLGHAAGGGGGDSDDEDDAGGQDQMGGNNGGGQYGGDDDGEPMAYATLGACGVESPMCRNMQHMWSSAPARSLTYVQRTQTTCVTSHRYACSVVVTNM